MNRKEKFFRVMEIYINQSKKNQLEEFYGKGAKIQIISLTKRETSNQCIIEAIVTLGEIIKEEYLHEEFADLLIQKSFKSFYPEFTVNTVVKIDS